MSQPLFGRTAGTDNAVQYAQKYELDFIDLHFRGDEAKLSQASMISASWKSLLSMSNSPAMEWNSTPTNTNLLHPK